MKSRFIVSTLAILIMCLAPVAKAQHAYRLSEKEMENLLSRIEKQADKFKGSLKDALNHSRLDDTKREDRINDHVKHFEEATDRLKHSFGEHRSAADQAEEVLRSAERIDDFMIRHELTRRAQDEWMDLRRNLDELAVAYNVSWHWRDR